MKVDVLLGLQWGDEGKGKIVDVLTPNYGIITRFQGGPNAGHTLEFDNNKHILHTIPSGIFRKDAINVIGNGVVIDPLVFLEEIEALEKYNLDIKNILKISRKAHLILPTHKIIDAASEAAKGKTKIGSTLKGIGPAYMDKTGRNGLRVGDIIEEGFKEKYEFLTNKHKRYLKQFDFEYNIEEYEKGWNESIELLKTFDLINSEYYINDKLKTERVLAEGAQGTLLDIDFGSYPYVTSSNTVTSGACTGMGIAPNRIAEVFGICKAYCTRVGGGPFPTEQFGNDGELLREKGHEFGSTTGRPRRCGWLDLVALKYSVMINGVSQIFITKADVLDSFETIKIATSYKINGKETTEFPFSVDEKIEPVYKEFEGWQTDTTKCTSKAELPKKLLEYLNFIEKQINVPVKIVSVGPGREQLVHL